MSRALRLVDANINRAGEGLRVLEDVARFLLDDSTLTQELRYLRHLLAEAAPPQKELLSARDVNEDVGAEVEGIEREDIPSLVVANARRAQESLRVLEEFGQLPELGCYLDSPRFKKARFSLYSLEQKLLGRVLRREKLEKLRGLYLILDTQALKGRGEVEAAQKAIRGGARVIQLRDKRRDRSELLTLARQLKELCSREGVLFMVNDYLDLALAADADGLHVGQTDMPFPIARRLMPIDKIVGVSTHSLEQALEAQAQGADYIGVGAIYSSPSKDSPVVGLEVLRQVRQRVSLPVVAIGGINQQNVVGVMAVGAQAAAVISAVLGQDDIETAARALVAQMTQKG